ncbi:MAG: pyridoxal phosphate-dependent aminotransferase, partial [Acetanaerobacterium sp.]
MIQDHDIYSGAQRLEQMYFSPIRVVLDKARAMREQGLEIIPFIAGEPDFNTPEDIKAATITAIQNNLTRYGSNRGQPRLREKIAARLLEETGVRYDPADEVLVTTSGAEAINNALLALLDEGDEVILFTPAFVNYENLVYLCGARVIEIPLKKENGFQIDPAQVKRHITARTKLIVINNPCNPTGVVYSKKVLEQLAALAVTHNLLVFSDEIYSTLVYEGAQFHSMASFPGMRERTITMNGFSKTFAMTGWRLGYLAADSRLLLHILKVHQYCTTCSPTFVQEGLADAMDSAGTRRDVAAMKTEFAARRELIIRFLDRIPGLSYVKPDGAFYVFVDVSATGLSGDAFAARLLMEKQ